MSAPAEEETLPDQLLPAELVPGGLVPGLRPGYRVPAHGVSRPTALADGLAAPWRVEAALDDPARLRTTVAAEAFSLHLLSDGARWAMVSLDNHAWHGSSDRHALLVATLAAAPVADSPSGLVQHFMTPEDDRQAHGGGLRAQPRVRVRVRLDALALLRSLDYPDRAADEFLMALAGWTARIEDLAEQRARTRVQDAATARADDWLARIAARGVHRDYWWATRLRRAVAECATQHWDPETGVLTAAHAAAEQAIVDRFFGNALD